MGLKTLLSDLTGGMSNYPSHNQSVPNSHFAHTPSFDAKSFSVYPIGQRKHTDGFSNQPFIAPVTWDITDSLANPTFQGVRAGAEGIPPFNYAIYNTLDGAERGGIAITANRRLEDTQRINRFLGTPQGQLFIDRQMSLQMMNPKIDAPQAKGLLSSSPANQRTYNMGINTLAQIAIGGGIAKRHLKREGTLPSNQRGYMQAAKDDFMDDPTKSIYSLAAGGMVQAEQNNNRLIYLFRDKISDNAGAGQEGLFDGIANGINNALNFIGLGRGEELYSYSGGPNSKNGFGRTRIGRYTNTGKVTEYRGSDGSMGNNPNNAEPVKMMSLIKRKNIFGKTTSKLKRFRGTAAAGGSTNYLEESSTALNLVPKGEETNDDGTPKLTFEPFKRDRIRKYKTGDPGNKFLAGVARKTGDGLIAYNQTFKESLTENKIDILNSINIVRVKENIFPHQQEYGVEDFIPFYFEAINTDDPTESDVIYFRAFLESLGDSYKASHNKFNYNGRAEDFYTYKSFDRDVSFSFKIAAQTRHEMQPLYRKLNYLVSNTAPEYDGMSGRIRTPFMRITIGHMIHRLPGVLSNISLKWNKEYPWEIKHDKDNQDKSMLILPHVLDVNVKFSPVHNFLPQKSEYSPFILPDPKDSSFLHTEEKWLTVPISGKDMGYDQLVRYEDLTMATMGELPEKGSTDYAATFHALYNEGLGTDKVDQIIDEANNNLPSAADQ